MFASESVLCIALMFMVKLWCSAGVSTPDMIRSAEFWAEVRRSVESGLSQRKASEKFGVHINLIQRRAKKEGWKLCYRGWDQRVTPQEAPRLVSTSEVDVLGTLLEQRAETVVIDLRRAEVSCQKVLASHSVRLKVAFSELVVQTVEDLRSGDVKPKDRALALGALKAVCDRLYGWDKEPDLHQLEVAQTAAINLELQATPPEKLKAMALARRGLLTPERDVPGRGSQS